MFKAGEPEPGVFGSLEPEPLEKNRSRSRLEKKSGAAKKLEIYLFYIFCSYTLLDWGEKNILPNLTNSQEPEPGF